MGLLKRNCFTVVLHVTRSYLYITLNVQVKQKINMKHGLNCIG